jgi:hypothetical protein
MFILDLSIWTHPISVVQKFPHVGPKHCVSSQIFLISFSLVRGHWWHKKVMKISLLKQTKCSSFSGRTNSSIVDILFANLPAKHFCQIYKVPAIEQLLPLCIDHNQSDQTVLFVAKEVELDNVIVAKAYKHVRDVRGSFKNKRHFFDTPPVWHFTFLQNRLFWASVLEN